MLCAAAELALDHLLDGAFPLPGFVTDALVVDDGGRIDSRLAELLEPGQSGPPVEVDVLEAVLDRCRLLGFER